MGRASTESRSDGETLPLEIFSLVTNPGHLLRRCQQRAVDLFAEEVGAGGPTPRQFAVLITVHQNEGINQTGLVELSGIDRSTLTEILRRLVGRGLIRRRRTPGDQRVNALFVSPAGRRLLRKTLPAVLRAQKRILEPIPPQRRAGVMDVLELLTGVPANGEDGKGGKGGRRGR